MLVVAFASALPLREAHGVEPGCERVLYQGVWICRQTVTFTVPGTSIKTDQAGAVITTPREPVEGDCEYTPYTGVVDPEDPAWAGNSSADGAIFGLSCYTRYAAVTGSQLAWRYGGLRYLANGESPPPIPIPDPETIVAEAFGEGALPSPVIHLGPDPDRIAVKAPMWMWIEDPQVEPSVITDPLGLISITVTPRVATTSWSPGDPSMDPDLFPFAQSVPPVVCEGLGEPPPASATRDDEGPCSYTYRWRSTAERTDDRCTWPLSVTVNWEVDWESNLGQAGTMEFTTATTTPVVVGEWRTVLVSDPSVPIRDRRNPQCKVG